MSIHILPPLYINKRIYVNFLTQLRYRYKPMDAAKYCSTPYLVKEVVNILNRSFAPLLLVRSVWHGPVTRKPQVFITFSHPNENNNSWNRVNILCFFFLLFTYSDGQPSFWKQRRNLVGFLAFLGFFNVYTLRVNLSVGIVAMTSSSGTEVRRCMHPTRTTIISIAFKIFKSVRHYFFTKRSNRHEYL